MEVKKTITFSASVRELASDRIATKLSHDLVEVIRAIDPRPFFAEMIIGDDGMSHGIAIMDGIKKNVNKIWSREMIQKLADKIPGVKIFIGHDDRDDNTRPDVGRTIKGFHEAKGGNLEARVIGYIKDEETKNQIKSGELDCCSIEADLILATDGAPDSFIVKAIEKVTGLALADSTKEKPGFGGASIVTAVQMMTGDPTNKEEPMELTKAAVEKFLADTGAKPSDYFGGKSLSGDDTVKGLIKATMDEKSADNKSADLKKEIEEKDATIAKLEAANLQSKIKDEAGPKIKEVLKGRKLSEAQAATLEKRTLTKLSSDESLDVAKLDEIINAAIEEGIQFLKDAGALAEDEGGDDKSGDKKPPAPPGSEPGKEKENPLIPKRPFA